jgi:hypothetical protein
MTAYVPKWLAHVGTAVLPIILVFPLFSFRIEAEKATGDHRRVIFNDDGCELDRADANTPEGFLKRRLRPLAATEVTTIAFSVLEGDAPLYASKVQSIFAEAHGAVPSFWPVLGKNARKLIDSGHCPLQLVIDFAHENKMEAFASIRMNDVHDSFLKGWQTIWKKEHPEFLVKTGGKWPHSILYQTSQDFRYQEVRERKFEIIDEVCSRYDIEGVELDFIRHPVLFSSVAEGRAASQEEVQIMTRFLSRLRKRMDQIASKRGKPLLLAPRIPDTVKQSLQIGLDVKTWLEKGLVDMLIVGGGYAPFSLSVDKIGKLAHQYEVPIYPCINSGPLRSMTSQFDFRYGVWALAQNWYDQGADGIYFFNLGSPFDYRYGEELRAIRTNFYSCLSGLSDPDKVAAKDKLYAVDSFRFEFKNTGFSYAFVSGKAWLPLELTEGKAVSLPLTVADELGQTRVPDSNLEAKLRVKLSGRVLEECLNVKLNGNPLEGGRLIPLNGRWTENWFELPFQPGLLKAGENQIEISRVPSADKITLEQVHLRLWHRNRKH